MAAPNIKLPNSPFVDINTGLISREWRQWLLNPQFLTLNLDTVLGIGSGGTGLTAIPGPGQLLIGTGNGYTLASLTAGVGIGVTNGAGSVKIDVTGIDAGLIISGILPAGRFPALTGDLTTAAGSVATTLATVNAAPGSYGSASGVATFTVNAKGLVTVAATVPINIPNTSVTGLGTMSTQNANAVAITGGTADSLAVGATTPSTGVFVGVNTNSNAAAGIVGEYQESILASSAGVALTTNVISNVTSLSLTAGDWDVSGTVVFSLAAGTLGTAFVGGSTQTSATFGPEYTVHWLTMVSGVNGAENMPIPTQRYSLAVTTTIYLIALSTFTVSTAKAGGILRARRVR